MFDYLKRNSTNVSKNISPSKIHGNEPCRVIKYRVSRVNISKRHWNYLHLLQNVIFFLKISKASIKARNRRSYTLHQNPNFFFVI